MDAEHAFQIPDAIALITARAEAAEAEVARLRAVLRLARTYVVKGDEQGAYVGCVLRVETVLARIELALGG